MTTYTQTRLDEYCKRFGLCKQKGTCQCKKELKFLADTIKEAAAAERERVVEAVTLKYPPNSDREELVIKQILEHLDSLDPKSPETAQEINNK